MRVHIGFFVTLLVCLSSLAQAATTPISPDVWQRIETAIAADDTQTVVDTFNALPNKSSAVIQLNRPLNFNGMDYAQPQISPILQAVLGNKPVIVQALLDAGADPNVGTIPPLIAATELGNFDTIFALTRHHAIDATVSDHTGKTALHIAVSKNDLHAAAHIMAIMFTGGQSLDAQDAAGSTALHLANAEITETLLALQANPNIQDTRGSTPLHTAPPEKRALLLNAQANTEMQDNAGNTPLLCAALRHDEAMVNQLLQAGAHINHKNTAGQNALALTLVPYAKPTRGRLRSTEILPSDPPVNKQRRQQIIEQLIQSGINRNELDNAGNAPLHTAVLQGRTRLVELLLAQGFDISVENSAGKTPLDLAAERNNTALTQMLVQVAVQNARNNIGESALRHAVKNNQYAIAKTLIEHGTNIATTDADGRTPLHIAAAGNNSDLVLLLMQSGAPIHAEDATGKTPYDLCKEVQNSTHEHAMCITALKPLSPQPQQPHKNKPPHKTYSLWSDTSLDANLRTMLTGTWLSSLVISGVRLKRLFIQEKKSMDSKAQKRNPTAAPQKDTPPKKIATRHVLKRVYREHSLTSTIFVASLLGGAFDLTDRIMQAVE